MLDEDIVINPGIIAKDNKSKNISTNNIKLELIKVILDEAGPFTKETTNEPI